MLPALAFASAVATQDLGPPRADDERHGWAEARLGASGLSEAESMRFGPSFAGAIGTGFKWLDLGVAGRYASVRGDAERLTTFGLGPEIALRKRIVTGATFRFAVTPQYVWAFGGPDAHARYGAEAAAQLFFTLEESTSQFLRAGLGLRAGRWASVDRGDPAGWSVGVDLIVRTFW